MNMQIDFSKTNDLIITPNPPMDDDEFFEFCGNNPDLQIERTAQGEIYVMPPAGGETSHRNNELSTQLNIWAKKDGRGLAFDSSGGFILPNRAIRAPDAAWVRKSWLEKIPKERKRRHIPLCPDFVIELISPSDRRSHVDAKMREWIDNGAELGWLIDADRRAVNIYRRGHEPQEIVNPEFVDGEGPVAGFRLELTEVWEGL
jgi:Uma2 family endonuclease